MKWTKQDQEENLDSSGTVKWVKQHAFLAGLGMLGAAVIIMLVFTGVI